MLPIITNELWEYKSDFGHLIFCNFFFFSDFISLNFGWCADGDLGPLKVFKMWQDETSSAFLMDSADNYSKTCFKFRGQQAIKRLFHRLERCWLGLAKPICLIQWSLSFEILCERIRQDVTVIWFPIKYRMHVLYYIHIFCYFI